MSKFTTVKKQLLTAGAITAASFSAQAAEWKSEAELGFLLTSGNSETQTTNAKLSVTRDVEKWTETLSLEALGSSNTDTTTDVDSTTAEKYAAKVKIDYKIDTANFLFLSGDYNDDRFSGFEYQSTVAAGYGRNIIQSEKQSLKAEIGPGVLFFKQSPDPVLGNIESDSESILHIGVNYEYKFSEQASFTQDLVIDTGSDVTITESITALKAQISGRMAMKASFKARNTSEVPEDVEDTDTETALTLVYSF